jgi:capsular exopolysaccharide synthesis family protein
LRIVFLSAAGIKEGQATVIVTEDTHAERSFSALRQFFLLVRRHKRLVVLPIIIGIVGGALIFMMTPKRYIATAVVALDVRKVIVAPLDMVASRLPQEIPALRTEIDILGSRSMAESVIKRLGSQMLTPLVAPAPDTGRVAEFIGGTRATLPALSVSDKDRQSLVDHLIDGLQISNDGRSFTIYIAFTDTDPVFAAKIANSYAEQYVGRAVPEAQLISAAQPPNRSSTPKLLPLMALGIFLGTAAGIGTTFLREHFDDHIWSAATLEERSELPVLGALPSPRLLDQRQSRWAAEMSRWLAIRLPRWCAVMPRWLAIRLPRWRAMMQPRQPTWSADTDYDAWLQRLQAVLRFSPATRDAKVLAVTSALQGEGKTFVSIALARAFAAAGSSALVVDADLYRPALAERLHLKASFSWEELISGKKSINDIVQQDEESNISVVAADASQAAPTALFTAPAFEDLIASLRERYDRIIIDTPPVAASADTAILSVIADVTILVVRWRATTYSAVAEALHQMALYSLPVAGIVLNQLDPCAMARYAPGPRRAPSRGIAALRTPPQERQSPHFIAVRGTRDQTKPETTDTAGCA